MRVLLLLMFSIVITACGGGGGGGGDGDSSSSVPETSAEGLWIGTMEDPVFSVDQAITALVLDDGTYWVWHSGYVDGLTQGTGISQNGSFTSSNGFYFSIEYDGGSNRGTAVSASYIEKQSLSGTFRDMWYGTRSMFSASYDADYELTQDFGAIVGTYSGTAAISIGDYITGNNYLFRWESQTLTISDSGAISGITTSGCGITGIVIPRSVGNAYNAEVSISGSNCKDDSIVTLTEALTGSLNGVAYFDTAKNTLRIGAVHHTKISAFVYVGTKL
jgi:hypothetical protein